MRSDTEIRDCVGEVRRPPLKVVHDDHVRDWWWVGKLGLVNEAPRLELKKSHLWAFSRLGKLGLTTR